MHNQYIGEPIQFELSSSDLTTAAALVLRDAGGAARTLSSVERVLLQTVNIAVASGVGTVDIFDDADGDGTVDAGERLLNVGEGFANVPFLGTDHGQSSGKGRVPKVKAASAGAVTVTGIGAIVRG